MDEKKNNERNRKQIGVHGVRMSLEPTFHATFLPDVMLKQRWSKRETMRHLLDKAGYDGVVDDDDLLARLQLERYRCATAEATFDHFERWRRRERVAG